MQKYLDYIITEVLKIEEKEVSERLIIELNLYKEYWEKYSKDNSLSPLYKSMPILFDKHNFDLPTGESVSISWDIDGLYKLANQAPINQASLSDFEKLLLNDLIASSDEISKISYKVNSIYKHKYNPVLVICFKPTQNALLLDGRHRYIEFKKFKSFETIPFYYLDDEMCFTNIIFKNELLTYIILHNIEVINNFITGQETLERLLNIKNCMGD